MKRLVIAALLCTALAACGILDSTGTNQMVITGQFDTYGSARIELPPKAGSLDNPPTMTLYVSNLIQGPFYVWTPEPIRTFYGDEIAITRSNDHSHLIIVIATSDLDGWYYRLVVVY